MGLNTLVLCWVHKITSPLECKISLLTSHQSWKFNSSSVNPVMSLFRNATLFAPFLFKFQTLITIQTFLVVVTTKKVYQTSVEPAWFMRNTCPLDDARFCLVSSLLANSSHCPVGSTILMFGDRINPSSLWTWCKMQAFSSRLPR